MWRTPLADFALIGHFGTRIVPAWVDACKSDQLTLLCKAAHVANLCHELGAHRGANAGHSHDGIILRELSGQSVHFRTEDLSSVRDGIKLRYGLSHQQFRGLRLWNQRKQRPSILVDCRSFCLTEIVSMTLAPLLVFHSKSVQAELGNTVHVPEGLGKTHPLLAAV